MFIDTISNRKSPPAVLLRESYREGGRVKKRTLANFSKLPQALIDGIAALLDGGKVAGKRAAEPGFEIVRSLPHGHVAAVHAVIRKLGLERTLQGGSGVDKRVRNLIEAMLIQRIIAPGSKLAVHRALAPATATSSLALSFGLSDVAEREVYAALDRLIEQQTRIEAALAKTHLPAGLGKGPVPTNSPRHDFYSLATFASDNAPSRKQSRRSASALRRPENQGGCAGHADWAWWLRHFLLQHRHQWLDERGYDRRLRCRRHDRTRPFHLRKTDDGHASGRAVRVSSVERFTRESLGS